MVKNFTIEITANRTSLSYLANNGLHRSDRRLCDELERTLCSGRRRRDNRRLCRDIGIRSLEDEDEGFLAADVDGDAPLPQEYQDLIADIADELEDIYDDSENSEDSDSSYDVEDESYDSEDSEDLELASEDYIPGRKNTRWCRGRGCQANGRNWRENRHRGGYWGRKLRLKSRTLTFFRFQLTYLFSMPSLPLPLIHL